MIDKKIDFDEIYVDLNIGDNNVPEYMKDEHGAIICDKNTRMGTIDKPLSFNEFYIYINKRVPILEIQDKHIFILRGKAEVSIPNINNYAIFFTVPNNKRIDLLPWEDTFWLKINVDNASNAGIEINVGDNSTLYITNMNIETFSLTIRGVGDNIDYHYHTALHRNVTIYNSNIWLNYIYTQHIYKYAFSIEYVNIIWFPET